MFSLPRKQAQQIAHNFLAGHCGLVAWWTLRHAGVLDAIVTMEEKGEGLDPLVFATRTNMALDVLEALLEYLSSAGLIVLKKDGLHLTAEGRALLEHEDGILEMMRAYEPVLAASEHLLAKLKSYGTAGAGGGGVVVRKTEALLGSQAKRYAAELYPAVTELVAKHKLTHLLDICCGAGELLVHIAHQNKRVVGVGMGNDAGAVRKANEAVETAGLEKRLIAVPANPADVCVETQRTFDRIGVSRQLWKSMDCVIATNLFGEMTSRPDEVARILGAIPRNFPTAHLLLVEAVASAKFDKNYHATEMRMLLRLARSLPWPAENWRETLKGVKFKVVEEVELGTDGLVIFLCKAG
jgi:SAM-dependent methyltransferase